MKKRTKFDPNEIIIIGHIATMILYKKNIPIAKTIFDSDDVEKVKKHKWYLDSVGYCQTRNHKKSIRLHRLIANCPIESHIDHINHDKLDNRKNNLRICTNQQNCSNQAPRGGRSKYKGVYWHKGTSKWCAMIHPNGRGKYLGLFNKEEDAARAYDNAARKHYGTFAMLNGI